MADEGNPLVATVDTGSWGGTANLESTTYEEGDRKGQFSTDALSKDTEGAGLFSDAASTIGDASSGNWGGLAIDVAGDGMDALGMAMDPLGSLAGAGIGWLIEHIGFLRSSSTSWQATRRRSPRRRRPGRTSPRRCPTPPTSTSSRPRS